MTGPLRAPNRRGTPWSTAGAMLIAAALGACSTAHYPINPALDRVDAQRGHRAARTFAADPGDRFFMHLAISGGGARAAALGHGVLEVLRDTTIRWEGREHRLVDELDMLMGVSGGSMIAGWYALHGADGLAAFESAFFGGRLQAALVARTLSPGGLWRIQSPRFGRGDLLAELLDERLFQGATFAQLSATPRKPFLIVYATDMATGGRFEFVQEQFDFLCSDLDGLPIARAVAASSAAPIVLSPITLWNHAPVAGAGCGEPLMRLERGGPGATPAAALHLAEADRLRAVGTAGLERPFLHLLDGGLSDNIGARGPLDYVAEAGSVVEGTRRAGYRQVRRVVFVMVNAETSAAAPEDRSADVPGPLRAALALADIPINRNSATALAQKRAMVQGWEAEAAEARRRGDDTFAVDAKFYLIEVNLGDEPDPKRRDRLLAIPTTLELSADDRAALREHAHGALRRSPDFQRLLRELAE